VFLGWTRMQGPLWIPPASIKKGGGKASHTRKIKRGTHTGGRQDAGSGERGRFLLGGGEGFVAERLGSVLVVGGGLGTDALAMEIVVAFFLGTLSVLFPLASSTWVWS
jgi:hypothetical protein